MSDNVDFVRRIYRDFERGEFGSLGWAHAEIEFVVADGPQPKYLRGLRAMLQHWREFLATWQPSGIVVDEYRELDARRVLVLLREHRGGDEARAIDHSGGAQVLDVRDGAITCVVTYFTREHALAALGVER
jgi:hypothetical protein